MLKAILFDLDGTLVNSLADLAFAVNRALKTENFPTHEVEKFKYFVGDGMPKMVERALPEDRRDGETVARMLKLLKDYYGNHFADFSTAYDDVPELVKELKNRGFTVAVVTNKAQNMADAVVKKFYGDMFDGIFGMREGIPGKPDPTMALIAMKELGVTPEECVFIGDSGMDVATGVNSGALPVGELWGYRAEDELRENGAKYIISRPEELLSVIEENL